MAANPEAHLQPADEATIQRVAEALTANNIEAVVLDTGDEARDAVLARIPEGSELHTAKSKTIEDIGLYEILNNSGLYDAARPKYMAMDRKTQYREIRKIMAAPDFIVGSVQALADDGTMYVVSYSAGQIGPYAAAAGKVLLVVGSQKIVPDRAAAMARIDGPAFEYEDQRLQGELGVHTKIAKLLEIRSEPRPGRTTVFLVREPVGI
jgi:hypothetical protein